jgi:hypothetical protein
MINHLEIWQFCAFNQNFIFAKNKEVNKSHLQILNTWKNYYI